MRMGEEIPTGKYACYLGRNPDQGILKQNQADGIIGYDNLPQAMLTVFVFCTLEGWVGGMYQCQDSFGWAVATLYHIHDPAGHLFLHEPGPRGYRRHLRGRVWRGGG